MTAQLAEKAWTLIDEVEQLGGMTKAIETGLPKLRIEEAAARKQARIDANKDVIVGVNQYKPTAETTIELLDMITRLYEKLKLKRLARIKAERNSDAVERALTALKQAAGNEKETDANLLTLAIEAARCRATLGEISDALETAFGRHKATIRAVSGIYSAEVSDDENFRLARELSDQFR